MKPSHEVVVKEIREYCAEHENEVLPELESVGNTRDISFMACEIPRIGYRSLRCVMDVLSNKFVLAVEKIPNVAGGHAAILKHRRI